MIKQYLKKVGLVALLVTIILPVLLCSASILISSPQPIEITAPSNSTTQTQSYRTAGIDGFSVWDEQYNVSDSSMSLNEIKMYFHDELLRNNWLLVDEEELMWTTNCAITEVEQDIIASSDITIYSSQEWIERPSMKAPYQVCLIVTPSIVDEDYLVRIIKLTPTFLHELNM